MSRMLQTVTALLMIGGAATGCSSVSSNVSTEVTQAPNLDCGGALASVIAEARGETSEGNIDVLLDGMSEVCPDEYDVATEYFALSSGLGAGSPPSCDAMGSLQMRQESLDLAREDGLCVDGASGTSPLESWPEGGLGWDQAGAQAGSVQRVCGPLASIRNTEDGAFLNIGRDYPDASRFTFIIWGFSLDPIMGDAVICGTGEIYLYDGVAQVELAGPEQIEIWR